MHQDIREAKDWADVLFLKKEHFCSDFTVKNSWVFLLKEFAENH